VRPTSAISSCRTRACSATTSPSDPLRRTPRSRRLAPGLWLQRLTTREPTLDQVAVSIAALQRVLAAEKKSQSDLGPRVEVMA
jgi:hypothetical protein